MTTDAERERLMRQLKALAVQRARVRAQHDDVTARLRDVVVALVKEHGVPELTAARAAGVGRQRVRTWTGADDGWPKLKAAK